MQLKHDLATQVANAISNAQRVGDLPAFEIPTIIIEHPRIKIHGDYAAAIAMQLARLARMAPLKIAETIKINMPAAPYLAETVVAPPGFINFRLKESAIQDVVTTVEKEAESFGNLTMGAGKKVQVECVSANPTGPITIGRTRGGVIGDTLARVLRAAGYEVVLEYYYNDAGRQIALLGESVKRRYLQQLGQASPLEDDHYQGEYVIDIARQIVEKHGESWQDKLPMAFADYAKENISVQQKTSLERVGIIHDVYFNENDLYTDGRLQETFDKLTKAGYLYEKDGAHWLQTTAFGDDEDRVAIRSSDGLPTYRMPDIVYHSDKAERGFDLVVDIFGPDHHAVAPQVLMGVKMLGFSTDFVHTLLHQVIALIRDGKKVRMSTRGGVYVTLDELVDEVGPDAVRYFILQRSANSEVLFDLDLAVERSDKNPVFYIQNAHVRCAGIFRKWEAAGHNPVAANNGDLSLLTSKYELDFLRKVNELPEVIELIATTYEPHHLAFYAYDLAAAFHPLYEHSRVLHSEVPAELKLARLRLYRTAQSVLARVLDLMGMSAPERM